MNASKKNQPQAYDIAATRVTAVVVAVLAVVIAVLRFGHTFTADGIRMSLPLPSNDATAQLTDGAGTFTGSADAMTVLAQNVNAVSTVSLGASIIVTALLWIGSALVMTIFVREVSAGTPFSVRAAAAITWGSYGVIGGTIVLMMLERFAQNGVAAAVAPGADIETGFASLLPYVGWWGFAFALAAWSLTFRRGAKLEQDTEGLV